MTHEREALAARLAAHRMLVGAPAEEIAWLAREGRLLKLAPGTIVSSTTRPVEYLYILFTGSVMVHLSRASGARGVIEWRGGDITGNLPYSRLSYSPGDVIVQEPTETYVLEHSRFPELIRNCPAITATLVHVMLDRARQFTSADLQDEKLMSLGRLAAGLAHELNNPASAVARNAAELQAVIDDIESASRDLGASDLSPDQTAALDRLRAGCFAGSPGDAPSPLERTDREEALDDWLDARGIEGADAAALVDAGVGSDDLDRIAADLSSVQLRIAVRWLAARCRARQLTSETETAALRVHGLVTAVKGFTYMDRAAVPVPVDVGRGLSDTVTVLASKARSRRVHLSLDVTPELPRVEAIGAELNQIWANLIENALDAAPPSGAVRVTAAREGDEVVVRVIDDGPGVPPEIRTRIFEPFFTTKPVGAGTGLGLDIASRLVQTARGVIDFLSEPGRTEFRVRLPIAPGESGGHEGAT